MSTLTARTQPKTKSRYPGRAPLEFYPTPPEATRALLQYEKFDGPIWEPACGNGAISNVLSDQGYDVISTDLVDRGMGNLCLDFLKSERPLAKHIVTNPPYGRYGLGDAFVRKALQHCQKTGGKVAMLLNLRSLAHPERAKKFRKTPPKRIYIVDQLTCWPNGEPASPQARIARQQYAWLVWEPGFWGAPQTWWLSPSDFK